MSTLNYGVPLNSPRKAKKEFTLFFNQKKRQLSYTPKQGLKEGLAYKKKTYLSKESRKRHLKESRKRQLRKSSKKKRTSRKFGVRDLVQAAKIGKLERDDSEAIYESGEYGMDQSGYRMDQSGYRMDMSAAMEFGKNGIMQLQAGQDKSVSPGDDSNIEQILHQYQEMEKSLVQSLKKKGEMIKSLMNESNSGLGVIENPPLKWSPKIADRDECQSEIVRTDTMDENDNLSMEQLQDSPRNSPKRSSPKRSSPKRSSPKEQPLSNEPTIETNSSKNNSGNCLSVSDSPKSSLSIADVSQSIPMIYLNGSTLEMKSNSPTNSPVSNPDLINSIHELALIEEIMNPVPTLLRIADAHYEETLLRNIVHEWKRETVLSSVAKGFRFMKIRKKYFDILRRNVGIQQQARFEEKMIEATAFFKVMTLKKYFDGWKKYTERGKEYRKEIMLKAIDFHQICLLRNGMREWKRKYKHFRKKRAQHKVEELYHSYLKEHTFQILLEYTRKKQKQRANLEMAQSHYEETLMKRVFKVFYEKYLLSYRQRMLGNVLFEEKQYFFRKFVGAYQQRQKEHEADSIYKKKIFKKIFKELKHQKRIRYILKVKYFFLLKAWRDQKVQHRQRKQIGEEFFQRRFKRKIFSIWKQETRNTRIGKVCQRIDNQLLKSSVFQHWVSMTDLSLRLSDFSSSRDSQLISSSFGIWKQKTLQRKAKYFYDFSMKRKLLLRWRFESSVVSKVNYLIQSKELSQKQLILQSWRRFVAEKNEKRRVEQKIRLFVVSKWFKIWKDREFKQRLVSRADCQYAIQLKRDAMRQWVYSLHLKLKEKEFIAKRNQFLLIKSFLYWRIKHSHASHRNQLVLQADQAYKYNTLIRYFKLWFERLEKEIKVKRLMKKTNEEIDFSTKQRIFRRWKIYTMKQQAQRKVERELSRKQSLFMKRRFFKKWVKRSNQRFHSNQVSDLVEVNLKKRYFHQIKRHFKNEQSVAGFVDAQNKKVKKKSFLHWQKLTQDQILHVQKYFLFYRWRQKTINRQNYQMATWIDQQKTKRTVMAFWKNQFKLQTFQNQLLASADFFYQKKLKRNLFQQWKTIFRTIQYEKEKILNHEKAKALQQSLADLQNLESMRLKERQFQQEKAFNRKKRVFNTLRRKLYRNPDKYDSSSLRSNFYEELLAANFQLFIDRQNRRTKKAYLSKFVDRLRSNYLMELT